MGFGIKLPVSVPNVVTQAVAATVPTPSLSQQAMLAGALALASKGDYAEASALAMKALSPETTPTTVKFLPIVLDLTKVNKELPLDVLVAGLNMDGKQELAQAVIVAVKAASVASNAMSTAASVVNMV